MKTLYEEVIALKIPVCSHYSDLYIPVNVETTELIKRHKAKATTFVHQGDQTLWYDIPFAYEPFWERKCTQNSIYNPHKE
jgi:hypothetical protein